MTRRVRIRTEHHDPHIVAGALRPDNTAEMETRVEDGTIVTTIDRDTTGGLRTTADDYVSNLQVAARLAVGDVGADDSEMPSGGNDATDTEHGLADTESPSTEFGRPGANTDSENRNTDTDSDRTTTNDDIDNETEHQQ